MILKAKDLHKKFPGLYLLKGISLVVNRGESIAIMGKSGEGKSTLLHIFGTLDFPTSGSLQICGKIPTPSSVTEIRNQHIGFIFQAYYLLEDFTVLDNVLIPLKIGRVLNMQNKKQALSLLEAVGLRGKENILAKFLSGGEKQRVAIARALVNKPDIILADEPTGNLDCDLSKEIQTLLLSLTKYSKSSLILVTHEKEFANMCDRTFMLKNGQLHPVFKTQSAPQKEFLISPHSKHY